MKHIDSIIVGQGIAGTSIAFRMEEEGKSYIVIDEGESHSASKVSSGIINPITGRRYVKSWMFDDLLPEALDFYNHLEAILKIKIIEPKTVLRALTNVLEENLWYSQSAKPDYKKYFGSGIQSEQYLNHFRNDLVLGEVKNSYRVNMSELMGKARQYFKKDKRLIQKKVSLDDFRINGKITFQNYISEQIIFAEGWKVINNPMFSELPFEPTKAEILICEFDNYGIEEIVKNKKFIVPLDSGKFWIGSTNELLPKDNKPNPFKKQELINFLDTYLNRTYNIIDHWTAIRPATKHRKPYIGVHPNHQNVYLFNGLGTKGASLAPYYSKQLVNHILNRSKIDDQVNISRFYNS